jgi:hypothetical protein
VAKAEIQALPGVEYPGNGFSKTAIVKQQAARQRSAALRCLVKT